MKVKYPVALILGIILFFVGGFNADNGATVVGIEAFATFLLGIFMIGFSVEYTK